MERFFIKVNSKFSENRPLADNGGMAHVMMWKEPPPFYEMDPMRPNWGEGFFDFGRTLQVLNAKGMSTFVEGHFEGDFFVLSDKTDKS